MNVSIIGSGNMARGIGTRLVASGHSVTYFARGVEKSNKLVQDLQQVAKLGAKVFAKGFGEPIIDGVVILAVPYGAMLQVTKAYRDQLPGKIVVDISNAIDYQKMELLVPAGSSAAEEVSKLLPQDVKLVKAFNTVFAGTLVEGKVDGQPLDIYVASNNAEAKEVLKKLIADGGMRSLDAGPLSHARYLEAMTVMLISVQAQINSRMTSAVKIIC